MAGGEHPTGFHVWGGPQQLPFEGTQCPFGYYPVLRSQLKIGDVIRIVGGLKVRVTEDVERKPGRRIRLELLP